MYGNVRRLALLAMLDLAQRSTPREKPMSDLSKLPPYQCHKRVRAVKIGAVALYDGKQMIQIVPADASLARFDVSEAYYQKHQPKAGGYFVLYEDGYQSYSPAEAFEAGYTIVTDALPAGSSAQAAFEYAMIDVARATDARGRNVSLYCGNWTADSLRDATKAFARPVIAADDVTFLNGLSEPTADEQRASETAFWENLAKLAKATAAAIRACR